MRHGHVSVQHDTFFHHAASQAAPGTRTSTPYTLPVLQRKLRFAVVAKARLPDILPQRHALELKSRLAKACPDPGNIW